MSDYHQERRWNAPATGRNHPETSREAAEEIAPAVPKIRDEVLAFARAQGSGGFIDDDLVKAHPDAPESSYRKRRSELSEEKWILDSGRRRQNEAGNNCVVWLHRHFVDNPPPLGKPPARATEADKLEGRQTASQMRQWARQMRSEGRAMFADGLEAAADLMVKLTL